jgi:hypothetical protein
MCPFGAISPDLNINYTVHFMHINIAHPPDPVEPLPRNRMASEDKFTAEAGASKTKMILGWLVNYRTIMVHLPENKFVAWSNELQLLIDSKSATAKQLDSNIGRMIHVQKSYLKCTIFSTN